MPMCNHSRGPVLARKTITPTPTLTQKYDPSQSNGYGAGGRLTRGACGASIGHLGLILILTLTLTLVLILVFILILILILILVPMDGARHGLKKIAHRHAPFQLPCCHG